MALIQMDLMSESLMRTVPVNVILPADKITFPGMPKHTCGDFKTLYLLHGVFGSRMDWVSGTNIQRWAEERDLAVVMPSGENMFYVDQEKAHNYYGEFIGKELVELTRKMFRLSEKREDTFIAGLSMGGYGALRNGLKYHETFGCIGALSAALITRNLDKRSNETPFFIEGRDFAESVFGNLAGVKESDKDLYFLTDRMRRDKIEFPKIYMCCGEQDTLLNENRMLAEFFRKNEIPVTYEEGPGAHDWDFWNRYIKNILEWLPLSGNAAGMSSGNVGI